MCLHETRTASTPNIYVKNPAFPPWAASAARANFAHPSGQLDFCPPTSTCPFRHISVRKTIAKIRKFSLTPNFSVENLCGKERKGDGRGLVWRGEWAGERKHDCDEGRFGIGIVYGVMQESRRAALRGRAGCRITIVQGGVS